MMNSTVFRARVITALLFLILGLVTLWQSASLPFGSLRHIQAGFFPIVFGSLLAGLSLLMLVQLTLSRSQNRTTSEETEPVEAVHLRGMLGFVGIFIMFLLVTYFIGFVIASFLALAAAGYLLGLKGLRLASLAIFTTAAIWLIFDLWLGISLPPGILF